VESVQAMPGVPLQSACTFLVGHPNGDSSYPRD